VKINDDGSITFSASLPSIRSAMILDGQGDGGQVKLEVPRSDRQAFFFLQDWAEQELEVTVRPRSSKCG
jgi:hypothetical protein